MSPLTPHELFALFMQFVSWSLLSVGGSMSTIPAMHRYVVTENHWLTTEQFTASVALGQVAPGPNILFVAVIGYGIAGLPGTAATVLGILLPSTVLTLWVARWGHERRDELGVRIFNAGLVPVTLGLALATGWLLASPLSNSVGALVLAAISALLIASTKLSPLWLVAAGATAGWLGWV